MENECQIVFRFDFFYIGKYAFMVKNAEYWGDVAHLDEIVYTVIPDANTAYQAWLNNEVDEIPSALIPTSEIASMQENGDYNWVNQEWPSPYYMTFNLNEGPFKDVKVRKAIAMGVDRNEVSEKAFSGYKPANDYFITKIFTSPECLSFLHRLLLVLRQPTLLYTMYLLFRCCRN